MCIRDRDGSYLSEFLIKKGYLVHGVKRRSSSFNTGRIDHIYQDPFDNKRNFFLHYGDVTDAISVSSLIKKIRPNEVYNLAAQSFVGSSFDTPISTSDVNAFGPLRILEIIRSSKKKIKFYQASTSEMFGNNGSQSLDENSFFNPQSPYAISKLYAHHITQNYRNSYGIFSCSGILFNHESPLRGEEFVTRKIVLGLINILKKKHLKVHQ